MNDRDIALGYAAVKNDGVLKNKYARAYKRLTEMASIPNLGSVLAINDNFALNSQLKKHLSCKQYDTVVLNETHQKYCFNVCGEDLAVDSFYIDSASIIDIAKEYDTILVDSSNITEQVYVALINLVNDDQNLITVYHGNVAVSPPDGDGNHIALAVVDMHEIRGKRDNPVILDEFSQEAADAISEELKDEENGNLIDFVDVDNDSPKTEKN